MPKSKTRVQRSHERGPGQTGVGRVTRSQTSEVGSQTSEVGRGRGGHCELEGAVGQALEDVAELSQASASGLLPPTRANQTGMRRQSTADPMQDASGATDMMVNPQTDFNDIINLLDPSELQEFLSKLGLSNSDIQKAECKANTTDVDLKAKSVLRKWLQRSGRQATRKAVLEALEKCGFNYTSEKLREKWGLTGTNSHNCLINHIANGDLSGSNGENQLQGAEALPDNWPFQMLKSELRECIKDKDVLQIKKKLLKDDKKCFSAIRDFDSLLKYLDEVRLFDANNLVYLPLLLNVHFRGKHKSLDLLQEYQEASSTFPLYLSKVTKHPCNRFKFVELKITGDIKHLQLQSMECYKEKLAKMLKIPSSDVRFEAANEGCIILVFMIPSSSVAHLMEAGNINQLRDMDVFGVHVQGEDYISLNDISKDAGGRQCQAGGCSREVFVACHLCGEYHCQYHSNVSPCTDHSGPLVFNTSNSYRPVAVVKSSTSGAKDLKESIKHRQDSGYASGSAVDSKQDNISNVGQGNSDRNLITTSEVSNEPSGLTKHKDEPQLTIPYWTEQSVFIQLTHIEDIENYELRYCLESNETQEEIISIKTDRLCEVSGLQSNTKYKFTLRRRNSEDGSGKTIIKETAAHLCNQTLNDLMDNQDLMHQLCKHLDPKEDLRRAIGGSYGLSNEDLDYIDYYKPPDSYPVTRQLIEHIRDNTLGETEKKTICRLLRVLHCRRDHYTGAHEVLVLILRWHASQEPQCQLCCTNGMFEYGYIPSTAL